MLFLIGGFFLVASVMTGNPLFFIVGGAFIMFGVANFLTKQAQAEMDARNKPKECPPHKWSYDTTDRMYCKACNVRPGQATSDE